MPVPPPHLACDCTAAVVVLHVTPPIRQEIRFASALAAEGSEGELLVQLLHVFVQLVVPLGRQGHFGVHRATVPTPLSFDELSSLIGPMLDGVRHGLPRPDVVDFARGLVCVLCTVLQHQTNVRKVRPTCVRVRVHVWSLCRRLAAPV